MIVLYFLACLTLLQGIATLIDGRRAARYMKTTVPPQAAGVLRTAVFCPCKGVDHEFEQNVRSILDQDALNLTVYFIVESDEDPAFPVLKKAGALHILVAGASEDCGQKVHNLRFAVARVSQSADVYVFCDSDGRYPRNWVRTLTAGVGDNTICSGYRWYVAERLHFPTLLRSAWNATAVSLLGQHGRNFVWGGSTAIQRSTFERIGVLDAWRGCVSDDYAITNAARRAAVRIAFVPACLIPSYGECSFVELLEFTTRQIIITRVYQRKLWTVGLVAQSLFNLTFLSLLAFGFVTGSRPALQVMWLALYGLSAARSGNRLFAVRTVLRDPSLWRFAWFYILSSPFVALLYQYNMVLSAFTSDIQWRQIHYKLISPNETRVHRLSVGGS